MNKCHSCAHVMHINNHAVGKHRFYCIPAMQYVQPFSCCPAFEDKYVLDFQEFSRSGNLPAGLVRPVGSQSAPPCSIERNHHA